MRTGTRHPIHIAALVFASLALVPAAQASTSPDDRALPRATTETLAPTNVSPDDRAYARDSSIPSATGIVSPDDRALVRGNWATPPTLIVSPDDRALPRAVPDPPVIHAPISIQPHGFDWGDALIGGTFGLALAMLGVGGVALFMRRGTLLPSA